MFPSFVEFKYERQHAETQQEEKNFWISKKRRAPDAECPRKLFPTDICIICDKKQKRLRGCTRYKKQQLVKRFRSNAETATKKAATQA